MGSGLIYVCIGFENELWNFICLVVTQGVPHPHGHTVCIAPQAVFQFKCLYEVKLNLHLNIQISKFDEF